MRKILDKTNVTCINSRGFHWGLWRGNMFWAHPMSCLHWGWLFSTYIKLIKFLCNTDTACVYYSIFYYFILFLEKNGWKKKLRQWEMGVDHHSKCFRHEMLHPLSWGHQNGDAGEAWASLSILSGQKISNTMTLNLYISGNLLERCLF